MDVRSVLQMLAFLQLSSSKQAVTHLVFYVISCMLHASVVTQLDQMLTAFGAQLLLVCKSPRFFDLSPCLSGLI
jgi:hypothetical protein